MEASSSRKLAMIPKWRDLLTSPPSRPMWESVGSLGASVEPAPMGAEVRPDAQGYLKLTEAGVKNDFGQDLTPTEKNILFAAQAPTAAAAFDENVSVASWKAKPSWYLVATADPAIQPSLDRSMAQAINAKTVEIASSHVAMLARPVETAQSILESAGPVFRVTLG